MISVIIPVYNEATIIENTLKQFTDDADLEIIVVDGNSNDSTQEIVKRATLTNSRIKIITSSKTGRANQMNCGAVCAKGKILLFLHADTILPHNYRIIVRDILLQKKIILGAFELKIDGEEKSLRFIETMVNLRSRFLSLPYGDQGFFLTQENFHRLGGFIDLPIMEDFDFVRRCKCYGKIAIAKAIITTSARRWQKLGVVKTTIINQLIILGYYLKVSPHKLRNFYRNYN